MKLLDHETDELGDAMLQIGRLTMQQVRDCATIRNLDRVLDKAIRALTQAGYTDCGGESWRPPLGPKPSGLTLTDAEWGVVEQYRKLVPGQCTMIRKLYEIDRGMG